ncbi:ATPase [Aureococcus anophagefferens]|nr:ATPase [Aureococcus anophagefferens]
MVDLRELAPALAACVVALVFAVAAFTTSGGRRGKGFAVDDGALYTALLDDDEAKVAEDDGAADGPYVVPSRSRLACRQAAYYVAGAWNAVAGAWFARRGTLDAAAPLVVTLAWLLVSAGDAAATRTLFFGADRKTPLRRAPRRDVGAMLPVAATAAAAATVAGLAVREAPAPSRRPSRRSSAAPRPTAPSGPPWTCCWPSGPRPSPRRPGPRTSRGRAALAKRPPTIEERGLSVPNVVLLTWLEPILAVGYRRQLQLEDLGEVSHFDRAGEQWRRFRAILGPYEAPQPADAPPRYLYRKLWRLVAPQLAAFSLMILAQAALNYLRIYAFKEFLHLLTTGTAGAAEALWASLLALIAAPLLISALRSASSALQFRIALRCRAALIMLIYRKSLRVSLGATGSSVGEIANLMSADVDSIVWTCAYIDSLWMPILQSVVCLAFIFALVGAAGALAAGVMAVVAMGNAVGFGIIFGSQQALMEERNKRLNTITEALTNIRIIKQCGIEAAIHTAVTKFRAAELKHLKKFRYGITILITFITSGPKIATIGTFLIYAAEGNAITPAVGFTMLELLGDLSGSFIALPASLDGLTRAATALAKINRFLDEDEVTRVPRLEAEAPAQAWMPRGGVELRRASFAWRTSPDSKYGHKFKEHTGACCGLMKPKPQPAAPAAPAPAPRQLTDVALSIAPGSLVVVYGATGSGKSSVLAALLGEISRAEPAEARVFGPDPLFPLCEPRLHGSVAYVAQKACRGINLSGGQQARVNLARACYDDADVYLLDDPLSAVDAHVGEHLFHRAVLGVLGTKTRILATHQVALTVDRADFVVIVGGAIVEAGPAGAMRASPRVTALAAAKGAAEEPPARALDDDDADDGAEYGAEPEDENAEARDEGAVRRTVTAKAYAKYVSAVKSRSMLLGILVFLVAASACDSMQSLFMAQWIDDMQAGLPANGPGMWKYAAAGLLVVVTFGVSFLFQMFASLRASKHLHSEVLARVLGSTVSWFDTTPVGRIQNRFSADFQTVDRSLMGSFYGFARSCLGPLQTVFAFAVSTPQLLPIMPLLCLVSQRIGLVYLRSAREMKRLGSIHRSPVYEYFTESLPAAQLFASRWLGVRLEMFGAAVTGVVAVSLVTALRGDISPALAGFVMQYSGMLTSAISAIIQTYSQLEIAMNSMEREPRFVVDGVGCETLPDADLPGDGWPNKGAIEARDVFVTYPKTSVAVLKGLSFSLPAGTKTGVVGRTGAGKSTLTLALVRMVPTGGGAFLVDGVDVSRAPLERLRAGITVVPQEPALFKGTIRSNVDLAGERSDDELRGALRRVQLAGMDLDRAVSDSGANLSVGERQLLCLARALLRARALLIMDEATANVDSVSDANIQKVIREELAGVSVLTIAHRLKTIIFYDQVLVLDGGAKKEFGSPAELIEAEDGHFRSLCAATGDLDALRAEAQAAAAARGA